MARAPFQVIVIPFCEAAGSDTVGRRRRPRHHPLRAAVVEGFRGEVEHGRAIETDDETAVHCLKGPSSDAVREALERVGIIPDRIVGAEPFGAAQVCASARRSISPRPDP